MRGKVFTPYLYTELGFSVSNSSREDQVKSRSKSRLATMLTSGTENFSCQHQTFCEMKVFRCGSSLLVGERDFARGSTRNRELKTFGCGKCLRFYFRNARLVPSQKTKG